MAPSALIVIQDVEVVQSGAPFKEGLPDVKVGEVMRREVATARSFSAGTPAHTLPGSWASCLSFISHSATVHQTGSTPLFASE